MEKKKILIIDDDVNIRKTLSDILAMKGYEIYCASDGAEAIDFIEHYPVNLLIIDLGLPDMSGFEILSKLKSEYAFTEAIILTGNASIDAAIDATNKGAFSFLLKPYDMEQLLLQIRRALEKQHIENTLRKSEERYRLIAENTRDMIWTFDLSKRVTYVSPSIKYLRGYTPEEAMQHSFSETVTPGSRDIALADLEEIFKIAASGEKRDTQTHEVEFTCKGGGTIWMEVSSSGLYDPAGRLLGALCTSRDISERKNAEAEKNRLIADLKNALASIRTLSGLIPICAGCKKIRNEKGEWEPIEKYISNRSEADFSHGICPECLEILYPDFSDKV